MTLQEYLVALSKKKNAFLALSVIEKDKLNEEITSNIKVGNGFMTVTGKVYRIKVVDAGKRFFIGQCILTGKSYEYSAEWLCQSVLDGRTTIEFLLPNNKTENDGKEILRTETERVEHSSISGRTIKAESSASVLTVGSGLNCYQAKGISLRS